MSNKILLSICIAFTIILSQSTSLKAQWVTIPDPEFAAYLQELYPNCMDGDQMDTTCNEIVNEANFFMSIGESSITNIDGIQYFDNLGFFYCSNSHLTNIPWLPSSVQSLNISYNNFLTTIEYIPSSTQSFYCDGNSLLNFIPEQPNTVEIFYCDDNTSLSYITNFSSSLQLLQCYNNDSLTYLPEFPMSLQTIGFGYNPVLFYLPDLPDSLIDANFNSNSLTHLPELPNSLKILNCSSNQLTSLPELPNSLLTLNCYINQISCFPILPDSIVELNIFDNPFTCLPNYINSMTSNYLAYPLCVEDDAENNPYGCEAAKGIRGKMYRDNNLNCSRDTSDFLLKNVPVNLFDEANNLISTYYSLSSGIYNFSREDGIYTVAVDTLGQPYEAICTTIGIDSTVTLDENTTFIDNIDFALNCKPGFDIGVKSIVAQGLVFPGQVHQLDISAGDILSWYNLNCASGTSGTVQTTVTGLVSYIGIPSGSIEPDAIDGNIFTYNIADLGEIPLNSFGLFLLTDTTALAGESICVTTTVTTNELGDNNTNNNSLTYCYPVVNSYDPNAKEVHPTTVAADYDGYFTYTIHFQNTGTAPAINIKLQDTLSTNLDLSTFEITAYSHPNAAVLTGNLINFKFANIWLPDSTSDAEGSKGFVQYRVKPISNLPAGTQITNTAYIYFDYNEPIQTNTAVSNFEIINSLRTYSKGKVNVYPNPNNGVFQINILEKNQNLKTIELTNLVGEKIWSRKTKNNTISIDINELPKGIYILSISDTNNHYTEKIIKN